MLSHFDEYNFVRLVCSFALGIIAYLYLGFQIPFVKFFLPVALFVLVLLNSTRAIRSNLICTMLYGIYLNLGLMAFGNYLAIKADTSIHPQYFINNAKSTQYLTIQIEKPFVKKSKYYKSVAQIKNIVANNETHFYKSQKLYINLKDVDESQLPQYGDILIIKNKLFEIDRPKNPGAFNYQRFSKLKQIYFQTYLSPNDYQIMCQSCGSIIWSTIYKLRNELMHSLKTHINDRAVLAITSALLLGQKDYITPEIQEMYADTGAMHILAVSGLHVGILLMLLSTILKPLGNKPGGKTLKAFIIITIIWLYAGITGFAPSVTRAALMFSLYLIGDVLNRSKNIYNVLAASAFLILLFKPNMIAEVGFQLSYAAVSMYYFNQFPLTFFIANLVAIPSATVIFVGGVGLLFFGFISNGVTAFIGLFLERVIQSLNFILHNLEQLPFATFEFNHVSFYIPFLIAIFFISIIRWLITNRRFGLVTSGICLLLLVIYHDYKNVSIDWIHGKFHTLLTKQTVPTEKLNRYLFKPAHNYFGTSVYNQPIQPVNNLFCVDEQTVFLIDSDYLDMINLPFEVDILVLSDNPFINLKHLKKTLNFKQVVFAANSNSYNLNRWKKQCIELSVSYHNIKEQGAFIWEVKQQLKPKIY